MVSVRPMDEKCILQTCLHEGPVCSESWPHPLSADYSNLPPHPWSDDVILGIASHCPGISHGNCHSIAGQEFMREMIQRYGTCAMLAWEDDAVVGVLRFYPMSIARLIAESQTDPSPVLDCTLASDPDHDERTLWVQCVMSAMPYESADEAREVGARRGIGLRLVEALKGWALQNGWNRIVKIAHCDIDWFYGSQGGGGKAFWLKAGFQQQGAFHRRSFDLSDQALPIVEAQMKANGMSEDDLWIWYRMIWEAK